MLTITRRIAVLTALLALLAWPAAAQRTTGPDQAAIEAAKELMTATGVEKQVDVMLANLIPQLAKVVKQLRPDLGREIDEVLANVSSRMLGRKQEMIDLVAPVYAQHLKADELREIAAFFKSAAGAKFVAAQPEILRQSMAIGNEWGRRIGAEIEAEARRELKSKGIEL